MKTTLIGIAAAIAVVLQQWVQEGKSLEDWKTYILPLSLAVLAYFTKDDTPKAS